MATKNVKVIIGSNYGDEGKGKATDYFAHQAYMSGKSCLVVLSNGGSQRGHTVVLPSGIRHVFRHFGSGSLIGAGTYIPKQFIVNPMNYALEFRELNMIGARIIPSYINPNCKLTTPFDMIANQLIEEVRGDAKHGSCGVGIWETILRDGITVFEMLQKTVSERVEYLNFVRDGYFSNRISSKGVKLDKCWSDIIYSKHLIDNYLYDFDLMMRMSSLADDTVMNDFDTVIFENGQGLLLDQNIIGYGKNTTPSNTGLQNAAEMIRKNFTTDVDVEVCYVSRTYMTRHGAGRFDSEFNKKQEWIGVDKTNGWNQFQGNFRFGELDVADLEQRVDEDFHTYGNVDWKKSYFFTHNDEHELPVSILKNNYVYTSYGPSRSDVVDVGQ